MQRKGNEAMKDINETRKRMDAIDEGLMKLFLERMELVGEVADAKRESGAAISDPAREREILSRVTAEAGEGNENAARLFFSEYAAETKVFVPTRPICTGADDDVPQSKAA